MPFQNHYLSGNNLDFRAWSEVSTDTGVHRLTFRIKGKVRNGTLTSATFRTLDGESGQADDNESDHDEDIEIKGKLIEESRVPEAIRRP